MLNFISILAFNSSLKLCPKNVRYFGVCKIYLSLASFCICVLVSSQAITLGTYQRLRYWPNNLQILIRSLSTAAAAAGAGVDSPTEFLLNSVHWPTTTARNAPTEHRFQFMPRLLYIILIMSSYEVCVCVCVSTTRSHRQQFKQFALNFNILYTHTRKKN